MAWGITQEGVARVTDELGPDVVERLLRGGRG